MHWQARVAKQQSLPSGAQNPLPILLPNQTKLPRFVLSLTAFNLSRTSPSDLVSFGGRKEATN